MIFRLLCQNDIHPWGIAEYVEKFSNAYVKLESLRTVLELYDQNVIYDDSVFIKTRNIDTFKSNYERDSISPYYGIPTSRRLYTEKEEYSLFGKSENPEMFWSIFKNNYRPDVYILKDGNFTSIMDIPESRLRFRKIEVNSPPSFDIEGAAGSIIDLFYAGEREDRKRLEFQNDMVEQSLMNLQGIVRTEEVINGASVSNGLKEYARQQLGALMAKQRKINEKIGLSDMKVDVRL